MLQQDSLSSVHSRGNVRGSLPECLEEVGILAKAQVVLSVTFKALLLLSIVLVVMTER